MDKELMIALLDARIMSLMKTYHDPEFLFMHEECRARMKEVLYIAEDLGAVSFEDYQTITGIIAFMGTDIPMEDRTW